MTYTEYLHEVIDDGISAATQDYCRPEQRQKREGSIAGFQACRDKSPDGLKDLLGACRTATLDAIDNGDKANYWWYRCYELEVEWVCNCVSVVLMRAGHPVIVTPTCRAVMQAAKIVGADDA